MHAGVVGGIAGAVLLAALAFFLVWARRRRNAGYHLDEEEQIPKGSVESYDRSTRELAPIILPSTGHHGLQ